MITSPHDDLDSRVRAAAMAWLRLRCTPEDPVVSRSELLGFQFEGHTFPLIDNQLGIRKPQGMAAALSILTTYTSDGARAPYEDAVGNDGLLRYKFQGNPKHYTNVGLRVAFEHRVPLMWFFGIKQGLYLPFFPVWIVAVEPERSQVAVALDEAQRHLSVDTVTSEIERRYSQRITKQRLHQPVFRQRVIQAYESACAMCRLRHRSLLDAAHIIPDRDTRGVPAVSNGVSLCKIHHAAYDENILGVRPDYVIEVRTDILEEIDGPMLKHGLQAMHNLRLTLPQRRADRPNSGLLEERYERFRAG
ncbi:HNH endonuclease [Nonomuraea angiospora]|uniref:HNH endonuclease n=1 Tax=Nonomuraea angiospora TaxID=46172 RepID=UPI0029A89E9C|nr:HNH endonuclease [Nonomuraea angiospora]MDX3099512.1 HNH endonuclease [Nonomuraea angiospora]